MKAIIFITVFITIMVCCAVVLIIHDINNAELSKEQIKQDAIYKTAELALSKKAKRVDVFELKSDSCHYYNSYNISKKLEDCKDMNQAFEIGFRDGFEMCKKKVLTVVLKEE